MDNHQEKWIEAVFQSMKGSQRARPRPELLTEIKREITLSKAQVIPLRQWKYTAVAATFILMMNATALIGYNQQESINKIEVAVMDTYSQSITSSFQIYE